MSQPPSHTQNVAHWKSYGRLRVFLRPYAGQLALVAAVSLFSTALSLAQPYISRLLIDNGLLRRDMRALIWLAAFMVLAAILGFFTSIIATYRYPKVPAAMLFDMRLALLRHLQTLSPRFYARFRLGDLMSRLNSDVGEVQRVSADTLLSVLSNTIFFAGSVAMMLWLNWRLFLVGVALTPVCVWIFLRCQRKLTALTRQLRERSADLGSLFIESILGMRTVISLRAGEHEAGRFRERNDAFVRTMLDVQVASFLTGALPATILTASTAAVFLYGGWLIIEDEMTVGALVAFIAYQTRLFGPVQSLMGMMSSLASARVSLARIFELFDTRAEVQELPAAKPLPTIRESIRLERVSLRHDRAAVLEDVFLEIPAGCFCAIVGQSGAGKSTLADLLARHLDPDEGRVLIDGHDARSLRLDDIRARIMLLDQTPFSVQRHDCGKCRIRLA